MNIARAQASQLLQHCAPYWHLQSGLYEFTVMKSHSSIVSGFNCRLYRKQGVSILRNTQSSLNDLFLQADQLTEEQIAGEYI